jgi:ketosteroid isomerase-like protein
LEVHPLVLPLTGHHVARRWKLLIFSLRHEGKNEGRHHHCALLGFLAHGCSRGQDKPEHRGTGRRFFGAVIVEKKIREAWQDFKAKKKGAYANLLADDFTAVEIDGEGPHEKQASVTEVGAGTLRLKNLKVTSLCANVALATYLAETDGTLPNGKVIHGTVAVTEVWVKRANEWKNLRYHESELK